MNAPKTTINERSKLSAGSRSSWTIIAAVAVAAVFGGLAIADQPEGTTLLRAVGQSCSDAVEGEQCASGICIDAWPFGNVCSALCASDAECTLENWGCHFVREPTGKMTGLCAPRRIGAN